jgi:hypothetical protein
LARARGIGTTTPDVIKYASTETNLAPRKRIDTITKNTDRLPCNEGFDNALHLRWSPHPIDTFALVFKILPCICFRLDQSVAAFHASVRLYQQRHAQKTTVSNQILHRVTGLFFFAFDSNISASDLAST